MITDYSEVIPHLFVTNWESSNDPNLLTKFNIRAVVTIERTHKPQYFLDFIKTKNINYMHIYLDDSPNENISKYFDESFNFINKFLEKNQNVVVHCMAGISRSVTIVLNYILRKLYQSYNQVKMSPKEVVDYVLSIVRTKRPFVQPNKGFITQLENKALEYQQKWLNNTNNNTNYFQRDLNYSFDNTNMSQTDCKAFALEDGRPSKVICLTNSDFDQQGNLINFPNISGPVMFYADWCGHCKHMKPQFAKFSMTLNGNNRAFAVDADKNKDLISRINLDSFGYTVRGFPTVCGYNNGKYYSNYSPDKNSKNAFRSAEDLADYSQGLGTAQVDYE